MPRPDPDRTAALAAAFAVGYSTALGALEQLQATAAARGTADAGMHAALVAGFSAGLADGAGGTTP